jgi:glycosyltransferase involved in cell wall biosynthesis
MATDTVDITILLPAYNEAEGIPSVIKDIRTSLENHYEIIVVDDGSTDATAAVAKEHGCRVIQYGRNRGKGFALRSGAAFARGKVLIVMDADGTYPAAAIPHIVQLLDECDMVRCRRHESREYIPPINRLGNLVFDKMLAFIHGLEGPDHLSGLYGFRMDAFRKLDLKAQGFDIEAEIGVKVQKKGFKTKTYPIEYRPRLGLKKLRPWRDGLVIFNRIFSLAILFNPFIFFIVPSIFLLLSALTGAFFLSRGPIITPYFGLSIHSYILANLGILGAFQLLIFGITTTLYGIEFGQKTPAWLRYFTAKPLRIIASFLGFAILITGLVYLALIILGWVQDGAGLFFDTSELVLAGTYVVWGLQIMSAALFLTIFSVRISGEKNKIEDIHELS